MNTKLYKRAPLHRGDRGTGGRVKLLTPGCSNHKIAKGNLKKYESAVLHLAPHTLAGGPTVCPHSSVQCRATCLYWAGRGRMPRTQLARLERTHYYLQDKRGFIITLRQELTQLITKARAAKKRAVVRLDGTSDLGLGDDLAIYYREILFYDYTKSAKRYTDWLNLRNLGRAKNRYLTFSRSETNWEYCRWFLDHPLHPGTVTVVFWPRIPGTWQGYRVINGDKHDFRFLDPPGVIVGLLAKGKAKKLADPTGQGFVVQV